MDYNKMLEEIENKKRQSRRLAKKAIVCFFAAAIVMLLIGGCLLIWDGGWFEGEIPPTYGGYIFEPNYSYDYNIMEDKTYTSMLKAEPLISFEDASLGLTQTLSPEDYGKHGDGVKFMTDFIIAIQMGDVDAYNDCFSRSYLIAEGKKKAENSDDPSKYNNYTDDDFLELGKEESFTMQQVYNAVITLLSETENEKTGTTNYIFDLKYKIRKNNGTLRTDMGSDVYRVQRINVIEDDTTGELKITSVTIFSSKQPIKVVYGWRIALVLSVALILIAGTVVGAVVINRKIGRSALVEASANEDGVTEKKEEKEGKFPNFFHI